MNSKEYIIIHHSAVSRDKNNEQFDAVKRYHIGKGWGNIGYHWFIEPDGTIKKGRKENEIGAHCKEKWMNYRSIGICLAGHFDLEEPTTEQLEALQEVIHNLKLQYKIDPKSVRQHHFYAGYKSCPGKNLPIDVIQQIAKGEYIAEKVSPWARLAVQFCKEQGIAKRWDLPQNPVTKEEMAVMLYRLYKIK